MGIIESTGELYKYIPIVKTVALVLVLVIALILVSKVLNKKSTFSSKGIRSEIKYTKQIKRRDRKIVLVNSILRRVVSIIDKSPIRLNKSSLEYWEYNVSRADIKITEGFRSLKAKEFHAIKQALTVIVVIFNIFIAVFVSSIMGWATVIAAVVISAFLPMSIVRQIVINKDNEIRDNFTDFYLMIHHVLIKGSGVPLSNIMKQYQKTTESVAMHSFVDTCIHYIETYGEYEAASYIAKEYREVSEVAKLMRLIKQSNEGGNVHEELMGFRRELINKDKYDIQRRKERLVVKARVSFYLLVPILVQAIISAMSIYLPDLGLMQGLIK